MSTQLDLKRISIFLLFAFAIAWVTGLVIDLTGGLANSPQLRPGVSLAVVLVATAYVWAPALAHLITRLVTGEGWHDLKLWPRLRRGWPYWLAAWFLPALATIVGAAIFFVLFPRYFDASLPVVQKQLAAAGRAVPLAPWMVLATQAASGILIAPIVNALPTFGEEFGWRAYLLPKLMPLGGRRAALVGGILWGIWHWPLILMGAENYGFNYVGYPWLGFLVFVWFTIVASIFQTWVVLRGGSVWPGVIGHGAINGVAGLGVLALASGAIPPLLLGPLPQGVIGSLGYALLALAIFVNRGTLAPNTAEPKLDSA